MAVCKYLARSWNIATAQKTACCIRRKKLERAETKFPPPLGIK